MSMIKWFQFIGSSNGVVRVLVNAECNVLYQRKGTINVHD